MVARFFRLVNWNFMALSVCHIHNLQQYVHNYIQNHAVYLDVWFYIFKLLISNMLFSSGVETTNQFISGSVLRL